MSKSHQLNEDCETAWKMRKVDLWALTSCSSTALTWPWTDCSICSPSSSGALAFDLPVDGAQSKEILPLGFNEMSCHIMKLYSRDCFQVSVSQSSFPVWLIRPLVYSALLPFEISVTVIGFYFNSSPESEHNISLITSCLRHLSHDVWHLQEDVITVFVNLKNDFVHQDCC